MASRQTINKYKQRCKIEDKMKLLNLARVLGNVAKACRRSNYSRDSYYRFKRCCETRGRIGLENISRIRPDLKNPLHETIEKAILDSSFRDPTHGQLRVSNELKKLGLKVSRTTVRNIRVRHDLETFTKRVHALKAKAGQENLILTEVQSRALERAQKNRKGRVKIMTEHPGYIGAQDTYEIGKFKPIGRIYQQTFIDTYTNLALVKLYREKNEHTAADLLNDRVLPFFRGQGVRLLRIMTDCGPEYCSDFGSGYRADGESKYYADFESEHGTDLASEGGTHRTTSSWRVRRYHEFHDCLDAEEIDHCITKSQLVPSDSVCKNFHDTIEREFYAATFRRKTYTSLDELQRDVDVWIEEYNTKRPYEGKYCYGKTPMQTFTDSKKFAIMCD